MISHPVEIDSQLQGPILMAAGMVEQDVIVLSLLSRGQTATIETVLGASGQVQRLREMGLCDGAEVQMIQPGSPCLIRLGERRLGLRSGELSGVLVRPGGF